MHGLALAAIGLGGAFVVYKISQGGFSKTSLGEETVPNTVVPSSVDGKAKGTTQYLAPNNAPFDGIVLPGAIQPGNTISITPVNPAPILNASNGEYSNGRLATSGKATIPPMESMAGFDSPMSRRVRRSGAID